MKKSRKQYKTLTYGAKNKQAEITVTNYGDIIHNGIRLRHFRLGKNPYVYVQAYLGKGQGSILINVARAILMAFRPRENYEGLQTDHIDSNPSRNVLSNLQWKTRADNNARLHTRRLKSKNHHHERHPDTFIRATKGNEVLEAKNGNRMAKMLGCSNVLIYRVLDPDDYAKTAKGWSLERLEME